MLDDNGNPYREYLVTVRVRVETRHRQGERTVAVCVENVVYDNTPLGWSAAVTDCQEVTKK